MGFISKWWLKIPAIILVLYGIILGFLMSVPEIENAGQTLKNLYFHVGMWFAMVAMATAALIRSVQYLLKGNAAYDLEAMEAVKTSLIFGILGLLSGMVWARFSWSVFWLNDPKLNGTALSLIAYLAYLVLRSSIRAMDKRARVAAVYNIFAFFILMLFVMIFPRLSPESIHPGNDGNPVLPADLHAFMRPVFYPAMIGWVLLSFWIFDIRKRLKKLAFKMEEIE